MTTDAGSGLSKEDERYLTEVSVAAEVPIFRLWYALSFSDKTALDEHQWQRLRLFTDYANQGGKQIRG